MNGSLSLGRFMGIPVRAHWMFLVLLYFLFLSLDFEQAAFLFIGGFGSVFLHELGHSLMARRYGIRVLDITFWPLGGMARMTDVPEDSKIESVVAIAGPAVNFVLAVLFTGLAFAFGFGGSDVLARMFVLLTIVNLAMGTFNLLPAFPMDGGRILRALLARTTDWVSATETAVRVGRICAALMFFVWFPAMLYGWPLLNSCALPLIAGFVWVAGARELMGVRVRHGISPFGGRSAFGGTPPQWTEPVPTSGPAPAPDPSPDPTGARRPAGMFDPEAPRGQGFSAEFIEELERSHGRLRRDHDDR